MTNLNIDLAVEYVTNIVNSNKCATCDRLNTVYLRFSCGHYNCQSCVATAEECLLCLTPSPVRNHIIDKPLSQRTEHISNLLTTFQDLFSIDVFRRQRISEQLKVEKQVFPECIQAPSKYCNKRKSTLDILIKDKENILPFYPGENISPSKVLKMENKNVYVKKWLDTNLQCQKRPRKAFTDLGVNRNLNTDSLVGSSKDYTHRSYSTKRKIDKTLQNESVKYEPIKKKKIKKKVNLPIQEDIVTKSNNIENDESGIFIDEDIIVIEESQNDYIDKDLLACQAVIEAEKNMHVSKDSNETQTSSIAFKDINVITKPKLQSMLRLHKVPFYKRSSLYETCNLCKKDINCKKTTSEFKTVTVVIDSNDLVTTLNISNCKENISKYIHKQSIAIQTEDNIQNFNMSSNTISENQPYQKNVCYKNFQENVLISNPQKGITVSESETDSDTDNERVNTLETIADVHSTASHFSGSGVLTSLESLQCGIRQRKVARGPSPLSTDSSDKENYDPNRIKKQKFKNKKIKK